MSFSNCETPPVPKKAQPMPNSSCGCNCGACKEINNDNYQHQENDEKHTKECFKCWDKIAEEMTKEYNIACEKKKAYEEEEDWKMYLYEGQYYKDICQ